MMVGLVNRKMLSAILLICFLVVNVSPTYALPFYGIDNQSSVFTRIGEWLGKEIKFNFKFGWDVNKIDYANKRMKCLTCKKRISMDLYAFTRGYCEKCYKGDKKAIKHFLAGKALLEKKNSKVRNMSDYKNMEGLKLTNEGVVTSVLVGIATVPKLMIEMGR